jgi:hypothetical protein
MPRRKGIYREVDYSAACIVDKAASLPSHMFIGKCNVY